jgi:hypothetical protein
MSSPQPAQATQVSKTELPQWVSDASQANYNLATDIAGRPLQQYGGPTVAGTSPLTSQAYDLIGKSAGSTNPLFDKATELYGQSADTTRSASPIFSDAVEYLKKAGLLQDRSVGEFDKAGATYGKAGDIFSDTAKPLDIQSFLNPYINEVQDKTTSAAELALKKQLTGISDQAQRAGAFGGSRAAVQGGVAQGEGVRNIGELVAQLRKAGFDTATANAMADRTGRQAAASGLLGVAGGQAGVGQGYLGAASGLTGTAGGLTNTGANIINQGTALSNTAAGLTNEAGARTAANTNDINALLTGGASQQQQSQAQIDAMVQKFNELRDYPIQGLNMRLAALGMSPYGKTETSNKTSTAEIPPTDWATLLLGGAKAVPALYGMSDRRTKTDIKKLTKGDIPIYAFRYKGDPKTYPKMVGPMAQDVKKKFPEAVADIGGTLAIDFNKLSELLA